MSHDKTMKVLFSITIGLLIIAIGAIVYLMYAQHTSQLVPAVSSTSQPTTSSVDKPVDQNPATAVNPTDAQTTITALQSAVSAQATNFDPAKIVPTNADDSYIWWISDDGWNIQANHVPELRMRVLGYDANNEHPAEFDWSKKIQAFAKDWFTSNGFSFNKKNSSTSETDDQFYDYIQAYEKNGLRCTVMTEGESYSRENEPQGYALDIDCIDKQTFDAAYNEQVPLLKVLPEGKEVVVDIMNQAPGFVSVNAHYRRTGFAAILAQIHNVWKVVYEGQDVPDCTSLNAYKVPKTVYVGGQCSNEKDQLIDYKGY